MDIVHDMRHRLDQIAESMKVNHLGLERVVKRFHIRIVPAAAFAAFTVQQVMSIEHGIQLLVGEFSAPVCVEYRPLRLADDPVVPSAGLLWPDVHCIFGRSSSQ